jgi:hypothetical protein
MKKFLLGIGGRLGVAIGGLAVFVRVASRDAPPPDEAEFRTERPDVAPADNAFTYFLEATNLLVETTNRQWSPISGWASAGERRIARADREKRGMPGAGEARNRMRDLPDAAGGDHLDLDALRQSMAAHGGILEARARLARLDGRFAEAADDLAVGMRFGHLVQKDASCLIVYLVGVAIFSMSAESGAGIWRAIRPRRRKRWRGWPRNWKRPGRSTAAWCWR